VRLPLQRAVTAHPVVSARAFPPDGALLKPAPADDPLARWGHVPPEFRHMVIDRPKKWVARAIARKYLTIDELLDAIQPEEQ
jgi:hypothetical protein